MSPGAAARHSQSARVQGRAAAEGFPDVAARPLDRTRARELVVRGECHEYEFHTRTVVPSTLFSRIFGTSAEVETQKIHKKWLKIGGAQIRLQPAEHNFVGKS